MPGLQRLVRQEHAAASAAESPLVRTAAPAAAIVTLLCIERRRCKRTPFAMHVHRLKAAPSYSWLLH